MINSKKSSLYKKFTVKRPSQQKEQKVTNFKQLYLTSNKNSITANSNFETIFQWFAAMSLKRMLLNLRNCKRTRNEYPSELKSFAMTLKFYNWKAYEHVRKKFRLALPAPSITRAWNSKVDCEPSF